jgi:hypothetical protein
VSAEAADKLALRGLFDAYAHCADRRDAEGQRALFTDDTVFAVYMEGDGSEPSYVLQGRETLTPVFHDLNRYEATTHFNGQSTFTVEGDRATGESYTIAHHVFTEDDARKIMVASLRYLDTFAKSDGWVFVLRPTCSSSGHTVGAGLFVEPPTGVRSVGALRRVRRPSRTMPK